MITAEFVFEGRADPAQATDDCKDLGEAIAKLASKPDFVRSPEAQGNFASFFRGIEDDVAVVTIWSGMSGYNKTDPQAFDVLKWLHGSCVHRLQAVFGVPAGQAGVGVAPKISSRFQAWQEAKERELRTGGAN